MQNICTYQKFVVLLHRIFGSKEKYNTYSMETYIIKRDGKKELFTIDKIKGAISKAFLAVGAFATEETLGAILSHLRVRN